MDQFVRIVESSALILEITGIAIILLGTAVSTVLFMRAVLRREPFAQAYTMLRRSLGRAILLGIEFLVGADIIGTVAVEPSYHNLGVLGVIVLIRTFLSFSLELEIEGRWPWQRAPAQRERSA